MVSLNSGDVSAGNQDFILVENAFLELLEDLLRTWSRKQRENQNSDGSSKDSPPVTPAQEPAKSQQSGKQDFGQKMLAASDRQIIQKTQATTALLLLRGEPTYESQFYRLENHDDKSVIQDKRTNQTIMEFSTIGTSIEFLKDKTNPSQRDEWLTAAQGLVHGKNLAKDTVNPYESMHEELNRLGGLAPLENKGILAANYLLNLHQTPAFQANERNVNRYIFSRTEDGGVQIVDKTTNEEIINYTPEGKAYSLKPHHVKELSEIYDAISLPNKDPSLSVLSGQLDYMLQNPSQMDTDFRSGKPPNAVAERPNRYVATNPVLVKPDLGLTISDFNDSENTGGEPSISQSLSTVEFLAGGLSTEYSLGSVSQGTSEPRHVSDLEDQVQAAQGQVKQGLSQRQSPQPINLEAARAASNRDSAAEGYRPSVKEMALWLASARVLGKSEGYQNLIMQTKAGLLPTGEYETTLNENPDFRGNIRLSPEQYDQMRQDISTFQGIMNDSGFEVVLKRANKNTPESFAPMNQAMLNREGVRVPKASDNSNSSQPKQSNKGR